VEDAYSNSGVFRDQRLRKRLEIDARMTAVYGRTISMTNDCTWCV